MARKGWMSPYLQVTKVMTAQSDVAPMDSEAVVAIAKMMAMKLRHLPVRQTGAHGAMNHNLDCVV